MDMLKGNLGLSTSIAAGEISTKFEYLKNQKETRMMKQKITISLLGLTFAVTAVTAKGPMDEATIAAGLKSHDRALHIKNG